MVAAVGLAATALHAQTGRIEGTVVGTEGDGDAPLRNATITVRGTTTGAKSSSNGTFTITGLKGGPYTLTASAVGYQKAELEVTVNEGQTTKAAFTLVPRAVALPGVTALAKRKPSYVANVGSTATKTSTPLRDVPASVIVVSEAVLKDQGASTMDQTIRNVSGLTQSSSSNYGFFNNYTVRGMRQRFLRDGVPDGPTTNGYARTMTDVDHIEVLKGPGSAIYGSSEPGGSINLVSKPTYAAPTLVVSQTVASYNMIRTAIDAGGPLGTQDLRSRVSLAYNNRDGYRGIGNRTIEILPSVTWTASDDHTLTFNLDYRKIEQDADTYGTPFRGTSLLPVPAEFDYHTPFGRTEQKIYHGWISHLWQASEQTSIRTNLMMIQRNLYLLRNSGGTIAANSDTMAARGLRQQTDDANDIVAQIEPTFNVTTGAVKHTILTGVEYLHSRIFTFRNTAPLPSITNVLAPVTREISVDSLKFKTDFDRDVMLDQVGVYAQDQVTVTDQFKIRAGLRWDQYMADDVHRTDSLGTTRNDGRISGQIGVVFQPIPDVSLYAGAARGSLTTVSTESNRITAPEASTQYELGTKLSLLNGQLFCNIALFHVTRENFNVTVGLEQLPVGAQRTQGVELDLSSQPTPGLGLTANFAYYDAKITNNPADTAAIGLRPTGVPATTGSFWTTYTLQTGSLEGLGFGGGVTYRDMMYLDAHNTRSIDSYVTLDATIFYRTSLLEVQLNGTNLTNTVYFRNGLGNGAYPGEPRGLQASARVNIF